MGALIIVPVPVEPWPDAQWMKAMLLPGPRVTRIDGERNWWREHMTDYGLELGEADMEWWQG